MEAVSIQNSDVCVIGAGVVGSLIARTLCAYQLNVTVLERMDDVGMGASRANSGIVHAGYDCKPGTLKAKLNVQGSHMMEQVAKELGVSYRRNTSMVIGFDDEDLKKIELLLEKGRQNGVEGLSILSGEQAREREPHLSKEVKYALLAPTGAVICPYELTIAAMGQAMDYGTKLYTGFSVREIRKLSGKDQIERFEIVGEKPGQIVRSRFVINCAGVFADEISRMVGVNDVQIKARKGEYMILDKDAGSWVDATIFRTPTAMGKGILCTRTVDGNLLLGPTAEDTGDKEDVSTSDTGMEFVSKMAQVMLPDVPLRKVITSFSGLRAVGQTGDFIIDQPIPGFIQCAGIESPGLSASPAIAQYVADMLRESGLEFERKKDYDPNRLPIHWFRELSPSEKNQVIKENPAFGRVVCRCETVTEGEILEALQRNPRPHDVDGIKRRTRAGMGRCQGGFCSPSVMDMIASTDGIPLTEVTKFGKSSKMLAGSREEGRKS